MHDKIEKMKQETCEIEEFKKKLFDKTKAWFESTDVSQIDTKELGECVDMVKDLAETNKECWEALYYCAVVKAMQEKHEEEEEMERYGYNPNHYPSSGRFASAGHGTRYGYPMMEPEMWARRASERFGYHDEPHTGMGDIRSGHGMNGMPSESEYGHSYDQYRESRRHYTETKDPAHKKEMDKHAEEHFEKTIKTFREIWADVDPSLRTKMKTELTTLIHELNG